METKICSKCGEEKQVSLFRYMRRQCKDCVKKYRQEYDKGYYPAHKDKLYAKVKKWRIDNSDANKKYSSKYRANNLEKCKSYGLKYRDANKDKIYVRNKKWRIDNPDKVKICLHKYKTNLINTLDDKYIKDRLKESGFDKSSIELDQELIMLRKIQIQLKRKLKTIKNESKSTTNQ